MTVTAGKGTQFLLATVPVGRLSSISGVAMSADQIDVTALDSMGSFREYIAGFKDGGDVPLSGFFDYSDAGQQALHDAFQSGETQACSIVFPTAQACKWAFSGVVTGFETSIEVDGAISFSATVKVSGQPVLSAVTG